MFEMDQPFDFPFDHDDCSNNKISYTNKTSVKKIYHDFRAQDDALFASISSQMMVFDRRVAPNVTAQECSYDEELDPEDVDPEDQVQQVTKERLPSFNETHEIFNYHEDQTDIDLSEVSNQLKDLDMQSEFAPLTMDDYTVPSGIVQNHQVEKIEYHESFHDSNSDGTVGLETSSLSSKEMKVSVENQMSDHLTQMTTNRVSELTVIPNCRNECFAFHSLSRSTRESVAHKIEVSAYDSEPIITFKSQIEPYRHHKNGTDTIRPRTRTDHEYSRKILIRSILGMKDCSSDSHLNKLMMIILCFRSGIFDPDLWYHIPRDASSSGSGNPLEVQRMRARLSIARSDAAILQDPSQFERFVQILQRIDAMIRYNTFHQFIPSDSLRESSVPGVNDGYIRRVHEFSSSKAFTSPG